MHKEQILDAIKDAIRELEELENECEWYSAGALVEKLELAKALLEHTDGCLCRNHD